MTVVLSRFTGKLDWVQMHLGEDGHGHGIDPDHVICVSMSRQ